MARRLGVAPSTLRTWDRRYGLGPTRHTGGRHRRYGVADIGRLELMQRALLGGASTAEAAEYALRRMPKPHSTDGDLTVQAAGTGGVGAPAPATTPAEASLRIETPDGEVVLPAEGGDTPGCVGERGAAGFARGLGALARSMDLTGVRSTLDESIMTLGALRAWDEVISPVLDALRGQGPGQGTREESVHLLTECAFAALVRASPVISVPRNGRPVLLASTAVQAPCLPVYVLAAGLGEFGLLAQPFGSALPARALGAAVRSADPAAVVLWACEQGAGDVDLFARLSADRHPRRLFAGGPGWDPASLPSTVELLEDESRATARIAYVVG